MRIKGLQQNVGFVGRLRLNEQGQRNYFGLSDEDFELNKHALTVEEKSLMRQIAIKFELKTRDAPQDMFVTVYNAQSPSQGPGFNNFCLEEPPGPESIVINKPYIAHDANSTATELVNIYTNELGVNIPPLKATA